MLTDGRVVSGGVPPTQAHGDRGACFDFAYKEIQMATFHRGSVRPEGKSTISLSGSYVQTSRLQTTNSTS